MVTGVIAGKISTEEATPTENTFVPLLKALHSLVT
jgi:hypothetical protein